MTKMRNFDFENGSTGTHCVLAFLRCTCFISISADTYIYISCVESRNMTEHPGDEIEMYFSDDELLSKNKTDSVDKNVSINNIW